MKQLNKHLTITIFFLLTNLLSAQSWDQVIKLTASDINSLDWFGISTAISGNYAVVTAQEHDYDILGNNFIEDAGAVYIYEKKSGNWSFMQKIVAPDRDSVNNFGFLVSISGNSIIISCKDNSSSNLRYYLFELKNGVWTEVQEIVVPNDLGSYFSFSGDYVISASKNNYDVDGNNYKENAGSAYIFKKNNSSLENAQKIVASDRGSIFVFGSSVSISEEYAVVGSSGSDYYISENQKLLSAGSVYIFRNNNGKWEEVQRIIASDIEERDYFGSSVSISGDYLIVGAMNEDHDENGDNFIKAAGSAYIFKNINGVWTEIQKIVALDREKELAQFGMFTAISGDHAIVKSYYTGPMYIFRNNNGVWTQVKRIDGSDIDGNPNLFGPVSISNNSAMVGNTSTFLKSSYIFSNSNAASVEDALDFPQEFNLSQNYPNPFNPTTTISYTLPVNKQQKMLNVKLDVFSVLGKTVTTLVNKQQQSNASYKVAFDASNLPSGVYFYRLQAGEFVETKKIMLLK